MIYHLALALQTHCTFFNLFHYVSVRAIAALLTSLFLSLLWGEKFIRFCQKNFRSKVREWVPDSHHKKNNTPTMGGLLVILIGMLTMLLWSNLCKPNVWIFLLTMICFGILGFIDDWSKIFHKKGISAKQKFLAQFISALLVSTLWYCFGLQTPQMCVPFFKHCELMLGPLLIFWATFVIVGTSNAVNLTDGLDGLATGPLIMAFSTFGLIAYLAGHKQFANYLYIPFAASAELAVIAASMAGVLIGFLWYNTYPAQIFMGDVGSLALGAGLGLTALMCRQELLLPLAGGIFVLETVSVIVQVLSYKFLGRRVFRMAPIHHHFELLGWKEAKITVRFWIISFVLCLLTLLSLKVR
ncbi:MAG: phospho-N-acetylmuramoyl-pentapeptide-transferase [Epsilonproteobacteria bacterium]|nr:phospho-N-acetylmuramoyl-pentapeptide-transferase [Campylobacterota bacterium]